MADRSATVTAALVYLTTRSLRNRALVQLRRLKNPRYAIALLVGILYFVWAVARPTQRGGVFGGLLDIHWALPVGGLAIALFVARWWLLGADLGPLAFTPAEVQFLFPAPVTRRGLVLFKLLRTQLLVLVNTLLWTALLRGGGHHLGPWLRALALYVLFATLQMHRLGAALVRASALEHGAAGRRRGVVPWLVAAFVVGALTMAFYSNAATLHVAWNAGQRPFADALATALAAPAASFALAPFRAMLAPLFAESPAAWARVMGPAVLLFVLHFVWVVRRDSAFEEAAVEASEQRAARLAARRAGRRDGRDDIATPERGEPRKPARRRAVPRLALGGPPGVAIVWKNVVAAIRGGAFLSQFVIFVVGFAATAAVGYFSPKLGTFAAGIAASWGAILIFVGPLWVRFDLRHDLPRLALLRTLPIPGTTLVAAEIASSALLLTLAQWALFLVAGVALLGDPDIAHDVPRRTPLVIAAFLAIPAINILGLGIQNAAALLFPGWVRLGSAARGVEAMGQNLLTTGLSLILLAIGLLLPAIGGALVYLAGRSFVGDWAAIPGVAIGATLLALELWPALRWLGRVYERLEPSMVGDGV